ncbi:protein RGF1 INDUCIBLE TRANSCRIPTION FACTOR 1-like [Miscanthus floridulus]|uniref:protein RGF1 INDUCIBLE TRANSCRIPTION FACTOR 1-like n=1 Tax=Miscanthus floridulus TaxID=154761 RepID=UPI0034582B1F
MKRAEVPSWLELLLATQFFTICTTHFLATRNECNLFCTQCEAAPRALCCHCRSCDHSTHRVIQIRRSSYHDVVRVSDIGDILDIRDVQTYIINSARVVFLNERPQLRSSGVSISKASSSSSHNCKMCGRALLGAFRFCSLGCNLKGIKEDMDMPVMVESRLEYGGKDIVTSNDNVGSSTASIKDSCNDNNEEEPPPKRIARHRRKGIPQRAPFF